MRRLEKRASEKELVAWPSSNEDLKNQKLAELLRSRIEELNRRIDSLNSDHGLFEKLLRMDDSRSSNSPTLWQRLRH